MVETEWEEVGAAAPNSFVPTVTRTAKSRPALAVGLGLLQWVLPRVFGTNG